MPFLRACTYDASLSTHVNHQCLQPRANQGQHGQVWHSPSRAMREKSGLFLSMRG